MTAQPAPRRQSRPHPRGLGSAAGGEDVSDLAGVVTRKLLAHVDVAAAAAVAAEFAPAPELELEPDWSFASAATSDHPMAAVRREIWSFFAERRLERSIIVPWLEGLRLWVVLGNDLSWCIYVGGSFEPNEFVFWKTVLRPGMVFVDGGANDGTYALFAARLVGPDGIVVAVEPSARELARLERNVAENGLTNVRILRAALAGATRRGVLAVAESGHEGQNTLGRRVANKRVQTVRHEDVALVTLDRLAEDEGLNRLDAVKLDLEGAEGRALRGARATIERFRPLLQVELNEEALRSQGSSRSAVVATLRSLGYRIFVFDRRTGQLRPRRNLEELRLNVIAAPSGWQPPALPALV